MVRRVGGDVLVRRWRGRRYSRCTFRRRCHDTAGHDERYISHSEPSGEMTKSNPYVSCVRRL